MGMWLGTQSLVWRGGPSLPLPRAPASALFQKNKGGDPTSQKGGGGIPLASV